MMISIKSGKISARGALASRREAHLRRWRLWRQLSAAPSTRVEPDYEFQENHSDELSTIGELLARPNLRQNSAMTTTTTLTNCPRLSRATPTQKTTPTSCPPAKCQHPQHQHHRQNHNKQQQHHQQQQQQQRQQQVAVKLKPSSASRVGFHRGHGHIRPRSSPSSNLSSSGWPCRMLVLAATILFVAGPSGLQLGSGSIAGAASPQSVAAGAAGLQQSMAQLLQVFNGNETVSAGPTDFSAANQFRLLKRFGEFALVGARNVVYNLSMASLREQRRLEWPASEDDVKMCRMKGKSADGCQNHIRVVELLAPDVLLVCGTNAYKPRCRNYLITSSNYELVSERPGEGVCPYGESQNVTSLIADGQLYSATAAQFSGMDGLIHRQPLRTEQFNPKQLNSPNFVSSFRYGEHVYFLFREVAIEHMNCGKTVYSRVGRVCVDDQGGPSGSNRDRWTSFAKARLNCSLPGDFPFYLDEIQAASQPVWRGPGSGPGEQVGAAGQELLYAVFTTPSNSVGASAVCAYRMADVVAAFEGPFKAQWEPNSNWLPVAESRVPQPRPGTCSQQRRPTDEQVNFLRDTPLMDEAVQPIWSQPLLVMASLNFRFTQIAVDPQVETLASAGAPSMRSDVLFVGTDDGRVFKLTNQHHLSLGARPRPPSAAAPSAEQAALAARRPQASAQLGGRPGELGLSPPPPPQPDVSQSTLVVEELHLFDSRTPVLGLLLHYPAAGAAHSPDGHAHLHPKLLALAAKQLKAIPLSRCERAPTCHDCLALYDPYCAWDSRRSACLSVGRSSASWIPPSHAHPSSPQPQRWFPANSPPSQPQVSSNNHTLGWWLQCPWPADSGAPHQAAPLQVGAPFRSLFSSHLQVPSRFDYASGHHLAHTSLLALNPATPTGNQPPQPSSECLTYCGGVYSAPPTLAGPTCADLLAAAASNSHALLGPSLQLSSSLAGGNVAAAATPPTSSIITASSQVYSNENFYLAVISVAVVAILCSLALGFVLGRNSKKHDSSICSSTFDETNLYMASTGSRQHHHQQHLHHPASATLLGHPHLQQHPLFANTATGGGGGGGSRFQQPLIQQHSSGGSGSTTTSTTTTNLLRPHQFIGSSAIYAEAQDYQTLANAGGNIICNNGTTGSVNINSLGANTKTNQSHLGSLYGNQQQVLLHLNPSSASMASSGS